MTSQQISFAGLNFKNPIIATSGTCGYGYDYLPKAVLNHLGGFIIKALSLHPKQGNSHPRVCETEAGFLNCIGLQNVGYEGFMETIYPTIATLTTSCMLNVVGDTPDEYVSLVSRLASLSGICAIELNLSCPNTQNKGYTFDSDFFILEEIIDRCVQVKQHQLLLVKLSPQGGHLMEAAKICEKAGADGLCIANTFVGMKIDVHTRNPMLATGSGGYSGMAVKPMVMHLVHQVSQTCSLPILAIGGVTHGEDVAEYLLAGASLVGIGTANLIHPNASFKILKQYQKYLKKHQTSSPELIGQCHT